MCSPEVWKHPQAHTLGCPPARQLSPQENTFVLEPALQHHGLFNLMGVF